MAIGSGVTPKPGSYSSSKSAKNVQFSVVKRNGSHKISNFGIYCKSSSTSFGAIVLNKNVRISSAGKFSYDGSAMHIQNGQPVGSAHLKFSGKFVTPKKATGTASFTKATQSGCPRHSFTATWSKS